jgi:DNA-binding MarR family transcriptional regulator
VLKVLPPVTPKQGKCLEFILNFFIEKRYYPTQREVAAAMGIQSNTAEMYIQPLVQKGYLTRESGKQRNIRLTPEALERLEMMGVKVQDRLADS